MRLSRVLNLCRKIQGEGYTDVWGTQPNYAAYPKKREEVKQSLLNAPGRFQAISEREDRSDMPVDAVKVHTRGKYMGMHHRACALLKTPTDQAVLKELLAHLQPATVIELGAFTGGNAIWMADMMKMEGITTSVYSMDVNLDIIEDRVKEIKPDNVTFLQGNSNKIAETFTPDFLKDLPHPWIINDDAHENIFGVMEHFVRYMKTGDYFIVEDTSPEAPAHVGASWVSEYVPAGTAKLDAMKKFLTKYEKECKVDSFFTDFFGYNGTLHWHGFIRRM